MGPASAKVARYAEATRTPLASVVVVLPLLLGYELRGWLVAADVAGPLLAERALPAVLQWIAPIPAHLSALLVVAALCVQHGRRALPWRVPWRFLPILAGESILAALPLWVLGRLLAAGPSLPGPEFADGLLRACGAAVYEEFLFRMLAISAVALLLQRWLAPKPRSAQRIEASEQVRRVQLFAIGIAAGLFAWVHVQPLGVEPVSWVAIVQRAAAGLYLGWLYVQRGFGVAVGAHLAYDVAVLLSPI